MNREEIDKLKYELVALNRVLSPDYQPPLDCDNWESLHYDRLRICELLNIDPVTRKTFI